MNHRATKIFSLKFSVLSICLLFISGCATYGMKVRTDHDRSVNLAKFQTFNWNPELTIDLGKANIDDDVLDKRIRIAIENQLMLKGYEKSDSPDFLISFQVALNEDLRFDELTKSDVGELGSAYDLDSERADDNHYRRKYKSDAYSSDYDMYGSPEPYQHGVDRGSLVVELLDSASKDVFWRSSGQAYINMYRNSRDKKIERINKAVKKMLKEFPQK